MDQNYDLICYKSLCGFKTLTSHLEWTSNIWWIQLYISVCVAVLSNRTKKVLHSSFCFNHYLIDKYITTSLYGVSYQSLHHQFCVILFFPSSFHIQESTWSDILPRCPKILDLAPKAILLQQLAEMNPCPTLHEWTYVRRKKGKSIMKGIHNIILKHVFNMIYYIYVIFSFIRKFY